MRTRSPGLTPCRFIIVWAAPAPITPGSVQPLNGRVFSAAPVATSTASPLACRTSSPWRTTTSRFSYRPITVASSSTLTPASEASSSSSRPMRKPRSRARCSFEPKNLWICLNSWPPGRAFSS